MSESVSVLGEPWPKPLPDFSRPPVTETVMAVDFVPVADIDAVAVVEFWISSLKADYPQAEERDRRVSLIESFDAGFTRSPRLEFRRSQPSPRFWFRSSDDENLIQLQNDWLAFNWRKLDPSNDYRHYPHGEERFVDAYHRFAEYLSTTDRGDLEPTQVEISYINHIRASDGGWSSHDEMFKVLTRAGPGRSPHNLPDAESQAAMMQFVARDSNGLPFGRLHVAMEAAFGADGREPLFVFTLTFRARPSGADLEGVLRSLDYGHHWIVGGFDELTTESMHAIWGRKERT